MITINIIIIIIIIIREEAVDYMEANTALSRVAVEREVTKFKLNFVFVSTIQVMNTWYLYLDFLLRYFTCFSYLKWRGRLLEHELWF